MSAAKGKGRPSIPAWQSLVAQPTGVEDLADAKIITLDLIDPSPQQARTSFNDEGLQELAASIRERGVLQPVRVRPTGARYALIAGERRYRAARMAGLTEIPAIVRDVAPADAAIEGLIENLQREDLNVVDRATGLQQLRLNLGSVSWEEVGRRVGLTERRVLQLVDVAKLPPTVQQRVRAGTLTEKHTRPLKGLSPERQEELVAAAAVTKLTPDETARAARAMKGDPTANALQAIERTHTGRTGQPRTPQREEPQRVQVASGAHIERDDEATARLASVIAQLEAIRTPQGAVAQDRARAQWARIQDMARDALAALAD